MKKISVLLLVCLFLSTPVVFGQTRSELPDFLGERGARGGSGRAEPGLAAPGKRAFYSLAGHLVPPGSRELRIEVRIAGRPLLSDVFQLPLDAADATETLLVPTARRPLDGEPNERGCTVLIDAAQRGGVAERCYMMPQVDQQEAMQLW